MLKAMCRKEAGKNPGQRRDDPDDLVSDRKATGETDASHRGESGCRRTS